ncbi:MAG: hypothetical protein HOQ28_21175 [Thermoleophilia bacterium]|nr:hypothetical protein [Thermoleophilia bacterium]
MKTVALVVLVVVSGAASGGGAATSAAISIRMFRAPTIAGPVALTAGPDRAVWFTNERARSVARITIAGSVTAPLASAISAPGAITTGRDGALWFVEGGSTLARMTPGGGLTEYAAGSTVNIASGTDGALWFTTGGKSVGRMTTTGEVRLFVEPHKLRGTYGIARGPDGAMWLTNYLGSSIGRIEPTGAVTTFTAPCVRYPTGITAGPDGALWFADDSGTIGRITVAGRIACFGDATRVGHPDAIVAGGDGALWAADRGGSIVRMTTHGVVTRYATAGMRFPDSIATGPNGTVWFTDYAANAVGRIARTGRPTRPASPRRLPRVTFISDSVAASLTFDNGAKSILASGVDLFLEPGQARTLGPSAPGGIAPPTVLELVTQLGHRLGQTVVVEIGDNDYADQYAANMEAALTAFRTAGVKHVLWVTLHVTPDHTSYGTMNDAIAAAASRHPELTIIDWNAYASAHSEWFQPDGVHLTGDGPRALSRLIHASLVNLGIPLIDARAGRAR